MADRRNVRLFLISVPIFVPKRRATPAQFEPELRRSIAFGREDNQVHGLVGQVKMPVRRDVIEDPESRRLERGVDQYHQVPEALDHAHCLVVCRLHRPLQQQWRQRGIGKRASKAVTDRDQLRLFAPRLPVVQRAAVVA